MSWSTHGFEEFVGHSLNLGAVGTRKEIPGQRKGQLLQGKQAPDTGSGYHVPQADMDCDKGRPQRGARNYEVGTAEKGIGQEAPFSNTLGAKASHCHIIFACS